MDDKRPDSKYFNKVICDQPNLELYSEFYLEPVNLIFAPEPLRAVLVLLSPMVSGGEGG